MIHTERMPLTPPDYGKTADERAVTPTVYGEAFATPLADGSDIADFWNELDYLRQESLNFLLFTIGEDTFEGNTMNLVVPQTSETVQFFTDYKAALLERNGNRWEGRGIPEQIDAPDARPFCPNAGRYLNFRYLLAPVHPEDFEALGEVARPARDGHRFVFSSDLRNLSRRHAVAEGPPVRVGTVDLSHLAH